MAREDELNNRDRFEDKIPDFLLAQERLGIEDTHPPVWRRVMIPERITFQELHEIIQILFGWEDMHLHEFIIPSDRISISNEASELDSDFFEEETLVDSFLKKVEKELKNLTFSLHNELEELDISQIIQSSRYTSKHIMREIFKAAKDDTLDIDDSSEKLLDYKKKHHICSEEYLYLLIEKWIFAEKDEKINTVGSFFAFLFRLL